MIKHLLSGDELTAKDIEQCLELAVAMKANPKAYDSTLKGKHLAILFEKPSLRTRCSFTVGMHQLGGHVIESVSNTRKSETPEDQMRVLQGYVSAVMIRTFEDSILEAMTSVATIPVINGLTDLFHPCQTLADLLTLKENFSDLSSVTITYLGDGNNILHSLLLMAPKLGVTVQYACPAGNGPNAMILKQAEAQAPAGNIKSYTEPQQAVKGSDAVYTDVWTSMGFEQQDESKFAGYQVNEALIAQANPGAIFLHCMPMERGKEVSMTLPDSECSRIFQQSENRLHAQKALLLTLLGEQS